MLKDLDLNKYTKLCLICGYTDMRMGINGLMNEIQFRHHLNPYDRNAIFLFCGRRASVIKGIVYEGDGIVMLTKKLIDGRFQWPRKPEEVKKLSREQFRQLMEGLAVVGTIKEMPMASSG